MFHPEIAVLNNISLDHKSLQELRQLFGDFVSEAKRAIWNADDAESIALVDGLNLREAISFGFSDGADFRAVDIYEAPVSSSFTLVVEGQKYPVNMQVPGHHNIANALASVAAASALGVSVEASIRALATFTGLARRFDVVGTVGDISVIDDFGHNPDKIAATLKTMKAFPGRIIAFFQPHGFGPIHKMGAELAEIFASLLDGDDQVILCDPVYFGGTVDRSIGSKSITDAVVAAGGKAEHIPDRAGCGKRIVEIAKPGDRIVIMGARDDTLSKFAGEILEQLGPDPDSGVAPL
ncbi:UDP-N-acetylmuramate--L-alanine ligase [hydrothermal vent metagenome]|uniref:UDP-N-acetylmuramate--L-alanine ligase n=1 Tax=hydrothermal vent metagenome TaxID=652676 RepID=A0A3B0SE61_9ZZZZ